MRLRTRLLFSAVALAALAFPAAATTFGVINTNDSGPGSLRQAILDANANPGMDLIHFSIGAGPQTISPISTLPTITDPVLLDATTQPGYAGSPLITLSGTNAGAGANGFWITAGQSIVQGFAVVGFIPQFLVGGGNGILLDTGGNNDVGFNYFGLDHTGATAPGNAGEGVLINNSSGNWIEGNAISGNSNGVRIVGGLGNTIDSNRIGTDPTGQTKLGNFNAGVVIASGNATITNNVISGNAADGVLIAGAPGSVVANNRIGTDVGGDFQLGNGSNGVEISATSSTMVGPGNVISANGINGVLLAGGANACTVVGNFIGTNFEGTAGIPNAFNGVIVSSANNNVIGPANVVAGNGTNGIRIRTGASGNVVKGNSLGINPALGTTAQNFGDGIQINDGALNNTIGGTGAQDGNLIVASLGHGIHITDATTSGNAILGNTIGMPLGGPTSISNSGNGVLIENGASGNTIGGASAGAGNTIHDNGGAGIFVDSGTNNLLSGNRIDSNAGLGIDLAPAGVTPNDPGDGDTGPNNLQNFPALSSASSAGSMTNVLGSLSSAPTTTYRVEFFASMACDPSGNGQGQFFLGSADVPTDATGLGLIDATLAVAAPGAFLTATATDPGGNTSEFSACVTLPGPSLTSETPTSGPAAGGTTLNLIGARFQAGATVSVGGAAAGSPAVQDDAHATAVSPALAPGALYDVTLTNLDGLPATLPQAWLADFLDVPQSHIFHSFVEKIFRHGVTAGCTSGNFCPSDAVTRAQVAVFLLRAHDGPSYSPPPATGTVFADVPVGSFAAAWIEELSRRSITAGCGGGNYCPQSPVTRQQMAVFLLRTEHGPTYVPPDATGIFADVPVTSGYARWVEQIFHEGITGGCGGGNFCPDNPTARGQMAVFLVVAFGLM